MIQELLIKNFAIIAESRITFNDGMTVLTGETGAGKSIIIDAIGQLLGDRANTSFIKNGEDKAFIEAILDISDNDAVLSKLQEANIDNEDDNLYVSKELLSNGKSICKINYRTVPASLLKQIVPLAIDIHSQFDNTELLNNKHYLDILDHYCGSGLETLLEQYKTSFQVYSETLAKKKSLENEEENYEQMDFYQSQLDEINQFDFENESVEELEKEKQQLQNFEKVQKSINVFRQYIQQDEGALSKFYLGIKALDEVSDLEEFEALYNELYDLYYKSEDVTEKIMDVYYALDFDEYRFNEVQDLLFTIQRLKRKYGPSVEMVLEKKQEIEDKMQFLSNREQVLLELDKSILEQKEKCIQLANKLHTIREKAAKDISKKITQELHLLYMEHARFEVQVQIGELSKHGHDKIEFMITTNLGQPRHPVSDVASGGELSRIMLALKTILLDQTSISTIIFDEVDTGVSGKVAYAIGQKMKRIAKNKQVLCITHLPQVASFADWHLYVSKYIENKDTKTKVSVLNPKERVEEIAKMLSGDMISEEALKQAQTLLSQVAAL